MPFATAGVLCCAVCRLCVPPGEEECAALPQPPAGPLTGGPEGGLCLLPGGGRCAVPWCAVVCCGVCVSVVCCGVCTSGSWQAALLLSHGVLCAHYCVCAPLLGARPCLSAVPVSRDAAWASHLHVTVSLLTLVCTRCSCCPATHPPTYLLPPSLCLTRRCWRPSLVGSMTAASAAWAHP